ncbi:MAG: argininosuccinate lyase [Candidatus Rokuibacteriota bacterium]|nr:MAG: argininosuccinate lyase [Candidatus Rokubacteria bacterium]
MGGMLKQPPGEYRGFRTPGIRLGEEMLPELSRLAGQRTRPMLYAIHAFDKAHAVMLVEEGLLSRDAGQTILRALRQMEKHGVDAVRLKHGGGLHSGEQYLIRTFGEDIGGRLHLARSSGDLSSVAINTSQRDRLLSVMEATNRLRRVLLRLASEHTGTVMPGYTFGQHAQPMTLAHLWLSWVATLERDFDRLHGSYRRVNVSPAGAVIMVGSDFPLNRARTAELLGFDAVHENAADAILELNADDSLDVPAAIALLYHSLAKWADDLILWSTREFHFVEIPDRFCQTSSIMMQKKNVIGPAEVKGASAEALGCFVTSYHALKGPTGLPVTERYYALEQLWRVADNCVRDMDWFCQLLPELRIQDAHLKQQAWRHWATATDLAAALVRTRDLPWRSAHQIVGIVVRLAEERGLGPDAVTPELLDEASVLYHGTPGGLDAKAIRDALDPERFVAARTLLGGPAPQESRRQAARFDEALVRDERTVSAARDRIRRSAEQLEAAIDALL